MGKIMTRTGMENWWQKIRLRQMSKFGLGENAWDSPVEGGVGGGGVWEEYGSRGE